MRYLHLEKMLVLSIKRSQVRRLNTFLRTLQVDRESAENVDCILEHRPRCADLFRIESTSGEELLVVFGSKEIHVLLQKNSAFEKLKKKALACLNEKPIQNKSDLAIGS